MKRRNLFKRLGAVVASAAAARLFGRPKALVAPQYEIKWDTMRMVTPANDAPFTFLAQNCLGPDFQPAERVEVAKWLLDKTL